MSKNGPIQGEGDYEAAKHYNEKTEQFARSGKVEEAARKAGEVTAEERAEMKRSEKEGKRHAHETDPNVSREYDRPG
jgi:hypothetical protein